MPNYTEIRLSVRFKDGSGTLMMVEDLSGVESFTLDATPRDEYTPRIFHTYDCAEVLAEAASAPVTENNVRMPPKDRRVCLSVASLQRALQQGYEAMGWQSSNPIPYWAMSQGALDAAVTWLADQGWELPETPDQFHTVRPSQRRVWALSVNECLLLLQHVHARDGGFGVSPADLPRLVKNSAAWAMRSLLLSHGMADHRAPVNPVPSDHPDAGASPQNH